MDKFGFIVHPAGIEHVYHIFPFTRLFPPSLVKTTFAHLPPFQLRHISGIRSKTGREIEGYFIACPLFSRQILELDENFVVKKVLATARIAEKLNVQVLGLGGLTGTVGEAGKRIAEESNLPVTNGTTFAAGACLETVLRAAELRKINLSKSEVAIIGATNSIGKICAYVLSKLVAQLSLVAKSEERLTALFDKLKKETRIQIENLGCDVDGAIHNADIVIFTTSAIEVSPHIETESLKKSAIICDIPMPRNISPDIFKARPDILVIDGAAIEPPCELRLDIDTALAENQIYACMAETMILTMEGRLENFSLGWEPSLEKLEQIRLLAAKHGFKPAFTSFGQKIV